MNQVNRIYLLNTFWKIQKQKGYIADEDVWNTSRDFGLSLVEIEGVISFYHFFHRQPAGKFTIYLNSSIQSYFSGFEEIKEAFEKETGAATGGVDPSGTFGLFETSCIGLSDREPAALINFFPFTNLTPEKVAEIIRALNAGYSPENISDPVEEKLYNVLPKDKSILFREFYPGKSLEYLNRYSPDEVIAAIKDSGLKGRGGAFFSTGMKWELCRKSEGNPKYIVCNADEGEPGSFKDRSLLNLLPGLIIEGMIIAGYAVGAEEGIIYLRAEYFWLLPKLEETIDEYRKRKFLGDQISVIKNFRFDIRIQMGAGAYICGEETALLESLEGKRGEPRVKTFFPTDKGVLEKPTVINNVETFVAVARIIELGTERFKSLGTPKSAGTKLLSISGDCQYPGIYEIEWGMQVSELLEKCGAEDPMFIQISGPSGELISMKEKERHISLEDLRCEGAVMIFNSRRDLFTILQNYSRFFTFESCGICTPCRAGNPQLLRMIEKLSKGHATEKDLQSVLQWSAITKNASRCGLGNTSPNSLVQAIQKFPDIIQPRLKKTGLFNPDFNLEKATENYNRLIYGIQE